MAGERNRHAADRTACYPVWDLPVRLLHGLIAGLFMVLTVTGLVERTPGYIHVWAGYLLLAAVLVRLVWGLVGSDSALFTRFVRGPRAVLGYLPRLVSTRPTRWPGHNPIGALYVVAVLALLLMACITGLFFESWAAVRGPLAERVPRSVAISMSDWHGVLLWPILALVTVHVLVTLGYRVFKSEDRIGAIFGDGRVELERDPGMRFAATRRAVLTTAVALLMVTALAWLGPVR